MPDKEDPTVSGFSQWALTKNIMLVKTFDPEEKIDSVVNYTTERIPVEQVISLADSPAKNFLEIVNLREFKEDAKKSNYQKAQEMAPELQIKQLSVSYYSDLNWDSSIDQFFHVYPFGNVEVGINVDPAPVVVEFSGKQLRKNGNGKIFNREADASLVNARGMLLPQFTYLNPNEKYKVLTEDSKESHSYEKDVVLKSGGTTKLYHSKKYKKEKVQMVMAVASGLGEKIAGSENQYSGKIQEEGLLFIGIENLKPLQTITLLFQFAEGSAEDEDNSPPAIHWSYLSDDELKPLKNENLVSDRTFGFQTTGIVKIDTPADASLVNQILPSNLIWFCASVTDHSNRIPQLINVIAQAAEFEFEDRGNDQSHFENALPAGSISKLTNPVAQVGKVEQPFNSFDGKHQEIGKEFYTRVSERLRHKGRAINSWDYEHLILDRFPSIYKVKCISHSDPDCLCRETVTSKKACCGPQVSPGHVLIVPVANLKNRNANNRLQPKTSRRTLIDIADFLKSKTSPFVHIHTANPKYEQVLVYFKVKFYKDIDKGFFLKKLNDEIVQFLTPWAFDQSAEVKFGEKIYASAIINFIEERTYVDFITDFQMYVCYEECCPEKEDSKIRVKDDKSVVENGHVHNDITEGIKKGCNCEIPDYWMQNQDNFKGDVVAKPSTSRSILVSVPQHIIIPYEAPDYISPCEAHKIKSAALASSIYDKDGLNNEGGIEKTLNKKDLQPKTKKHHSKVEGNKTASGTGTKKNSK
ncbi:MAG: hypothetical protein IPP71_10375 [Bacteroidetes bacterium]|nr:hypothetical protein [Bacteroidota bacterium]